MALSTTDKIGLGRGALRLAIAVFVSGAWLAAVAGTCPPPAAVNDSVLLAHGGGVTTISWTDPPGPYAVYCGSRAPGAPWAYNHVLLGSPIAGSSVTDSTAPASEALVWYLVARQDACGESIAGQPTSGPPILGNPLLDVLAAVDNAEFTDGAFVTKNVATVTGSNFSGLKFNMRPFSIAARGTGTTVLSASTPNVVEIFEQNGTPVSLPAAVPALPVTWLINGTNIGETTLRVDHTPSGGPTSFREVDIHVGCLPGLAGEDLSAYPFFNYPDAFNQNGVVRAALDPVMHQERSGRNYNIHVVPHRTAAQWAANNTLTDSTGTVETAAVGGTSIATNRTTAWSPAATTGLYDVVFDFYGGPADSQEPENTPNGQLDPGDVIGLLSTGPTEAEVSIVADPGVGGALATASYEYDVGPFTIRAPFDGLSANYTPTRIRGRVVHPNPVPSNSPLVVIAHGNHYSFMFPDPFPNGAPRQVDTDMTSDENYRGYGYLQNLLASRGFVTVSIALDDALFAEFAQGSSTGLIGFRGWVILKNIEALLNNPAVAGPTLGQIDPARISLVGHSRGGEAVLQALKLLNILAARPLDGGGAPEPLVGDTTWEVESIASISAVSFYNDGPPLGASVYPPFLTIFGSADGDVNGFNNSVRPYRHYDRANGDKQVITIFGADHNFFNTSWPCDDATAVNVFLGPGDPGYDPGEPEAPFGNVACMPIPIPVGSNLTTGPQQRAVAQGYIGAFLEAYPHGQAAYRDFFARPPSSFRPPSVDPAIQLHNQYRLRTDAGGGIALVLDDYQTQPSKSISSSGQAVVTANLLSLSEADLIGPDPANPASPVDRFTQETKGAVIAWSAAGAKYEETVALGSRDFTLRKAISFRIAQQALQPQTTGLGGDMSLTLTLEDESGRTSSIVTSALTSIPGIYSARIPFSSADSSTESVFKTLRFEPCLFKTDGRDIDLTKVKLVRFQLTPSPQGRFGFDDLELTDR